MELWENTAQYGNDVLNNPADIKHHGLYNQGATCYLNSVLQVLFMTKDFREAVQRSANENPELSDLFDDLEKYSTYTVNLTRKLGIDKVFEQRDAAEYLEKILQVTSHEASKIFHGRLVYKTTCLTCGDVTKRDSPFWHLPLLLNSSANGYSVVDGLEEFFRPPEMSGENQMYCEPCDTKVDAIFEIMMEDHPDVLVLLLKRFDFNYQLMSFVKNNQFVDIPDSLPVSGSVKYELYAVVDHFGDLRSGHYNSKIKSQDDSLHRWYIFDDMHVELCEYQPFQLDCSEKSQSAYLLFYRKGMFAAQIDTCGVTGIPTDVGDIQVMSEDDSERRTPEDKGKKWESTDMFAVAQPVSVDVHPIRKLECSHDENMEQSADIGSVENERKQYYVERVEDEYKERFLTNVGSQRHDVSRHAGKEKRASRKRVEERTKIKGENDGRSEAEKQTVTMEDQISEKAERSRDFEGSQMRESENQDVQEAEGSSRSERGRKRSGMHEKHDRRITATARLLSSKQSEMQVIIIEEESNEIYKRNSLTEKVEVIIKDETSQSLKTWKETNNAMKLTKMTGCFSCLKKRTKNKKDHTDHTDSD